MMLPIPSPWQRHEHTRRSRPPPRGGVGGRGADPGGAGCPCPDAPGPGRWRPGSGFHGVEHSRLYPGGYRSARTPRCFMPRSGWSAGALASSVRAYYDSGRQAARLVDKILKGAKPARDSGGGEPRSSLSSVGRPHTLGGCSRAKPCFRPTGSFVNLAGAVTCAAGRGRR